MRKPIEGVDFFVRLVDFPAGVKCDGAVTPNDDSTFSIYLNSRMTQEQIKKACDHECRHIEHDDLYRDGSVEEMERSAG